MTFFTSSSRPTGEWRYPRIRRRRPEGRRSAPKKGATSRCGGGGESMNDDDICSCTVTLLDRHGLCAKAKKKKKSVAGEIINLVRREREFQRNMAKIPLAHSAHRYRGIQYAQKRYMSHV